MSRHFIFFFCSALSFSLNKCVWICGWRSGVEMVTYFSFVCDLISLFLYFSRFSFMCSPTCFFLLESVIIHVHFFLCSLFQRLKNKIKITCLHICFIFSYNILCKFLRTINNVIYIYIYLCVCVCVCVYKLEKDVTFYWSL